MDRTRGTDGKIRNAYKILTEKVNVRDHMNDLG
jgi:hypothetical protein